jgi:molecular chaperone DnaK (HSP70)
MARFLVGIDLGTTHTVVAYAEVVDQAGAPSIELFEIEQLVAPGEVAALPQLPSLRYHPLAEELDEGDMRLPWTDRSRTEPNLERHLPKAVVGAWARELGSRVPGRLVSSAKSWLSHAAVERTAPILPWGAPQDVAKVSPVQASASYLDHVRAAWNARFPADPLESQDLVLTVPASFDEVARTLTVEAARSAGLTRVRLLEEPQAACYDWLNRHQQQLVETLGETRLLLVCDVGGGTTDLTMIKVAHDPGGPRLTRIGVGDHLMLGGDNMDLALAHIAEGRLIESGARLSTADLSLLIQQCRAAKERLLAPQAPLRTSVTLLGGGGRLVGGARSTELDRAEVRHMVIDGFFPLVEPHERPQRLRGGIVEFGLPYVPDPAVTRHLAAFLAQHAQAAREALADAALENGELPIPDAVLLNGGIFRSQALAERLLAVLGNWRGGALKRLNNHEPHLAVARGAVAFALTSHGKGLRIGGGSARSYFVLVEAEPPGQQQGVCILPRGTEEGKELELQDRTFSLRLGQPVQFLLASSTGDRPFQPGELTPIDAENFLVLPPLATVLGPKALPIEPSKHEFDAAATNARRSDTETVQELPVHLATRLTEVGTLEISCAGMEPPAQRWRLAFQLRGATQAPSAALPGVELHPRFGEAAERILRLYGERPQKVSPKEVKALRVNLEKLLGKRDAWDTPLLRELFGTFWEQRRRRRRSADHERLWLNLIGYCLRPGFGYPLDDWRVQQLWSVYGEGVQFASEPQVWAAWWTMWRRIGGGLDARAQDHLLRDIAHHLQPASGKRRRGFTGPTKPGYDDMVRLAGTLERLPPERKLEVGDWLLQRLRKPGESPHTWWAVGRIGARVPFYGSAHTVIDRNIVVEWLDELLKLDWRSLRPAAFAATLLARVSGDRERDLEEALRAQVAQRLRSAKAPSSWVQMVQEMTELDEASEQLAFGESLPPGLRLLH